MVPKLPSKNPKLTSIHPLQQKLNCDPKFFPFLVPIFCPPSIDGWDCLARGNGIDARILHQVLTDGIWGGLGNGDQMFYDFLNTASHTTFITRRS